MDPTVTATETTSQGLPPIWRAASELVVGDRIAAGFLPDGESADVLFSVAYRLSANRDPFVLVVFRADDGDPDDYHFRADSRIPLEAVADPSGLGHGRDVADDPTPVSPARIPPHVGAPKSRIGQDGKRLGVDVPVSPASELLVDETAELRPWESSAPLAERVAESMVPIDETRVAMAPSGLTLAADQSRGVLAGTTPVVTYFSFGHGQTDPGTGKRLLDHYATVVAPTYEACREAMLASRFGRAWSFDYLAGTARATEWIPRWTEHEVIVAPGTDPALAETALKAAREVLTGEAKAWVHYRAAREPEVPCGQMVADLPWLDGTSSDHAEVTCKACIDGMPF